MNNVCYDVAMLSMYIGRPLLGQRVEDALAALDVLAAREEVDYDAIDLPDLAALLADKVTFQSESE